MIDNPQLGYPEGPMPEDQHAQQLDRLHQLSPDPALPPMEAYETLTEQIPASPLDNTTVALDVASQVDIHDHAAYAHTYTDRIVQATQEQFGDLVPDNTGTGTEGVPND